MPIFPKVWGRIDAINRLIWVADMGLPNWASEATRRFQTWSTKCVHYASQIFIRLFRNPFRMNLRPVKPCAVIKGTKWLKIMYSWFGNSFYVAKSPTYIIIFYITSPQPRLFVQTLQCPGWIHPGNIIMLLQGHLPGMRVMHVQNLMVVSVRRPNVVGSECTPRPALWKWGRWKNDY